MASFFSTLLTESQKHLLRRLYSLSGVVPLAGYLVVHLGLNARVLLGPRTPVETTLAGRAWWQLTLEFAVVIAPLLFHGLYGLGRTFLSPLPRPETVAARGEYTRSEAWVLRGTGLFLLVFIVYHWSQFRYPVLVGAMHPNQVHAELCAALSSTISGGIPLVALVHLLGLAAASIHLAYGLRAFLRSYQDSLSGSLEALAKHGPTWLATALFALGALTTLQLATGSWLP